MAETVIGGRYRLDRLLASGGMGSVWLGWDTLLERPVAVKKLHLPPGLPEAERDVAVRRIIREARIAARLHHPHAVQVFDVANEDDVPCLVMQYVPSRSLQELVLEGGPLPPAQVAGMGGQVASALAAAHAAGIVHRDVTPGNVLISEDGTARITDFGISHTFGDPTLTATGIVTGTPAFLAPEVARGAPSDFASDVYSLGSTLYMAVEGQPPFGDQRDNPIAVLHRVASGHPRPPARAGVLAPILWAMMTPEPERRPRMTAVTGQLRALADRSNGAEIATKVITREQRPIVVPPVLGPARTRALAAPGPTVPPPIAQPPPEPAASEFPGRSRSYAAWIALVIIVALAAVIGILLLRNGGTSGGTPTAQGPATTSSAARTPTKSHSHSAAGAPARHATSSPSKPASAPSTTPSAPPSTESVSTSVISSATVSSSAPAQHVAAPPTDSELADAIMQYFQLVPDNLDAAWQRLTRNFQNGRAGGRANFDSYWNTVQSVDTADVTGQSPHTAYATLTYHYKNGQVVTERTTFTLVRRGGVLKIAAES